MPERLTVEQGRALLAGGAPRPAKIRPKVAWRCSLCGAALPQPDGRPCGGCGSRVKPLRFPSKTEAARYDVLRQSLKAGLITDLELQPSYRLAVQGIELGWCRLDFRYRDLQTGAIVVEDAKGRAGETPISAWKRRHLAAQYGVKVMLTGDP